MIARRSKDPNGPRPRTFGKASRAALDGVWGLLLWFWGDSGTPGGDEDGLREVVTLFGFLLVWQAALLAYVQSYPNVDYSLVAVYIVVSIVLLIGMFSISRTPTLKPHHSRIGWRLSMLGFVLVVCLGTSYVTYMLPGQYETGTFLDTGTTYLGVNLQREAVPFHASLWRAELSERATKHWRIEQVLCYRDNMRTDRITTFSHDPSLTKHGTLGGQFDTQGEHTYYFLVKLEEIGTEERNFKFSNEDLVFELTLEPGTEDEPEPTPEK